LSGDPVPQALVITAIVVAFSATAIAIALLLRLHAEAGTGKLEDADPPRADDAS
jgi:multicomponent Na+:H+ antiporter subunit C